MIFIVCMSAAFCHSRSFDRKVKSFARYVQTFWAFCVLQVFPEGVSRDDKIQNYLYKLVVLVRFCNLLIIRVLRIAPESLQITAAEISKSRCGNFKIAQR